MTPTTLRMFDTAILIGMAVICGRLIWVEPYPEPLRWLAIAGLGVVVVDILRRMWSWRG